VDVLLVVDDVQVEHVAASAADVAVAEIPTKKLGVRGTVEFDIFTARAGHVGVCLARGVPRAAGRGDAIAGWS
jgi:hypothetical protein